WRRLRARWPGWRRQLAQRPPPRRGRRRWRRWRGQPAVRRYAVGGHAAVQLARPAAPRWGRWRWRRLRARWPGWRERQPQLKPRPQHTDRSERAAGNETPPPFRVLRPREAEITRKRQL